MNNHVGILVGHFGRGTGAQHKERDEWELASEDATELALQLRAEGKVRPTLIRINADSHPWDLFNLEGRCNIDVRAAWAVKKQISAAIEMHVNHFRQPVQGHEVFVRYRPGPKTRRLGSLLQEELSALGNKDRGLKQRGFRILRKLHSRDIPAALVEPAFITEDVWHSKEWRLKYVEALKRAVYRYFNV